MGYSKIDTDKRNAALLLLNSFFRQCHWFCTLFYALTILLFRPKIEIDTGFISIAHLWGDPMPHFIYVGYLDGYLLMGMRMLFPSVEWFSVLLMGLNIASIWAFSYCVIRTDKKTTRLKNIMAFMAFILFLILSIRQVYYAFTASAATTAALIMLFHSAEKKSKKMALMATVLMLLGASVRYDSVIAIIPFCAALGVHAFIYRKWAKLAICLICILVVSLQYICQPLMANVKMWPESTEAQNLISFNDACMRFRDYPDAHDAEKDALYAQAGGTECDKQMIIQNLLFMPERSQTDWVEGMARVRDKGNEKIPKSFDGLMERMEEGVVSGKWKNSFLNPFKYRLAYLALLILIPLPRSLKDGRLWLAAAAVGSFALLLISMRYHSGTVFSVQIITAGLLLYETPASSGMFRRIVLHFPKMACILLFLSIAGGWGYIHRQFFASFPQYKSADARGVIEEECRNNPGTRYICTVHDWFGIMMPQHGFLARSYDFPCNIFPVGIWTFELPSMQQEWHKRGYGGIKFLQQPEVRIIGRSWAIAPIKLILENQAENYGEHYHLERMYTLGQDINVYRIVPSETSSN